MTDGSPVLPLLLVVHRTPGALSRLTAEYEITEERQIERAITLAKNRPLDLVLLDAGVSGALNVCIFLKEYQPDLPILVVNVGDLQDVENWLAVGADDVLLELSNFSDLNARLRIMLSRLRSGATQRQRLHAALQAERDAKMMTDNILNNLSHELRTPLLQVKAAVSMLRTDTHNGQNTAMVERLAELAFQAAGRLEATMDDLTQLAVASQPKRYEPFLIPDMVNSIIHRRSKRWGAVVGLDRIRCQWGTLPPVMSDRAAVSQILQQLLDNALKFSEEKSPVEIIASRQGELIQVSIRDYGIGIPAEHRPHIFKMFYQVDSDSSRRYGGAGIGLALVKMLADGLNVEIQVESTVGRGSTFSFYLPIADLN